MEIELKNLKYKYKKSDKEVICGISEKLKKNNINFIIGLSGSGKSTLIKMLNGEIIPTSGEIILDKFKVCSEIKDYKDLRHNIGIVLQNPEKQIMNMTVRDEIGFNLDYCEYKKDKEKRIKDSLKMVGLNNSYLERNPLTLSYGEMKLIVLASILAINPKVIVLDEIEVGLDKIYVDNLIKIIRLLKNRFNKTIIIVSKNMDFVHKLADYIYLMANGKIVKSGNKYEIFKDKELLSKYHIETPKVIEFSNLVLNKKKVKLGYRDEINDLLKDIYRLAK